MNSLTDSLYDENNRDNIILYSELGQPVEFEQVAVLPLGDRVYTILKPVADMIGVEDNEALVFSVETEEGEEYLSIVEDYAVIDKVFEMYYKLLEEME